MAGIFCKQIGHNLISLQNEIKPKDAVPELKIVKIAFQDFKLEMQIYY